MAAYNYTAIDADMENFLDLSGGSAQSPVDPLHSSIAPEHTEERQGFSGPSHEYDRFKQQTGLPSGSMSNLTSFNNEVGLDNDFMSQSGFYADTSNVGGMDTGYNSGFQFDMDCESTQQSSMPAYMFPGSASDLPHTFVPSSNPGFLPSQPTGNPTRMWPGMHSQQAQQARAEASARREREQEQGRHIMQSRTREQSGSGSSQSTGARKSRSGSQAVSDPAADERISRILDQMRHNSNASVDDDANSVDESAARTARMKKDDEELDEDERLLASEEGKKLTSKERRQLRNKVSARAFRSRRKEYITQLEGEVAAKTNECDELKLNARRLVEENNQLKHLTRTLLSHPAFQTFLEDMSRDSSFIAPPMQAPQQVQHVPNQPNANDHNGSNLNHQNEVQVQAPTSQDSGQSNGNVMQQHNSLDISMLNLGNSHWSAGNAGYNFQQPQVFALHEVPEGPSYEEIVAPKSSIEAVERVERMSGDCPVDEESPDEASESEHPCFALFNASPARELLLSPFERPSTVVSARHTSTPQPATLSEAISDCLLGLRRPALQRNQGMTHFSRS